MRRKTYLRFGAWLRRSQRSDFFFCATICLATAMERTEKNWASLLERCAVEPRAGAQGRLVGSIKSVRSVCGQFRIALLNGRGFGLHTIGHASKRVARSRYYYDFCFCAVRFAATLLGELPAREQHRCGQTAWAILALVTALRQTLCAGDSKLRCVRRGFGRGRLLRGASERESTPIVGGWLE